MGGDEFVLILPSATLEAAEHIAAQLRERQKEYIIEGLQLSISLGVSVINSREEDFDMRLAESDKNMYIEKRSKKSLKS